MRSSSVRTRTRSTLRFDQFEPARRGVIRCLRQTSSMGFMCPSIQPKQSTSSTSSGQVMLATPLPLRASLTHSSSAVSWLASSQARSCSGVSKGFGSATLNLGARHDVVAAVLPAHPCLVAAVVVVAQEDERRLLVAEDGARLASLFVEAAPEADERVVLELVGDRRRVGVAGADGRLA